MSKLNKYEAIIFDWDGTLVDTCGLILEAHNHVRKAFDLKLWTMDDFLGTASKSAREYYPEIYNDKADEAQRILYDYVEEHHLNYLQPMEGAIELIEFLDHPVGIVSNKRHKTLQIEVSHLGWGHHFDCNIGAGIAEKDKPSSAPLLMGMEEIGAHLRPENILYVGDTETDLLTAKNTGCDVAFIQSDGPRPDLIDKYQPTYDFMSTNLFYSFIREEKGSKTAVTAEKKAC